MGKIKRAIIPAAGLGTRFLPATKAQPKEMLPIVDKPALQYIIEEAIDSGIEEILIITGRNKRSIEDHFDRSIELELELEKKNKIETLEMVKSISNMADIYYIRQKEPNGLGDAIYCARSFIKDEPFAVLLGDDIVDSKTPCLKQLMNIYDIYEKTILGVQKVNKIDVFKYGILDAEYIGDGVYKTINMIEKPSIDTAPSDIAILGRYILTPEILDILKFQKPGINNEIQLTDALKILLTKDNIYAYNFEGNRYDIGDKLSFLKANIDFALKRDEIKSDLIKYLKEKEI